MYPSNACLLWLPYFLIYFSSICHPFWSNTIAQFHEVVKMDVACSFPETSMLKIWWCPWFLKEKKKGKRKISSDVQHRVGLILFLVVYWKCSFGTCVNFIFWSFPTKDIICVIEFLALSDSIFINRVVWRKACKCQQRIMSF